MQKVTVQSPANIAFIKYWGQTKHNLYIPMNDNISMTLSNCLTVTTVHASSDFKEDIIKIQQSDNTFLQLTKDTEKNKNAYEQIKRVRKLAQSSEKVLVKTKNMFPMDAGIASSASGFSALTGALLLAFGQKKLFDDKKEFSKIARLSGSASAARSVFGGFVELHSGKSHDDAFSQQIADEKSWDLVDIIAVVSTGKKKVSTSIGHAAADSSPYFHARLVEMPQRIKETRQAIIDRNIEKLGSAIEADAISMHAVMMTSNPPLYYWEPGTIAVIKSLINWREQNNLQAFFTIDAGANVHVITEKKNAQKVQERLQEIEFVKETIYNEPVQGTHEIQNHLF